MTLWDHIIILLVTSPIIIIICSKYKCMMLPNGNKEKHQTQYVPGWSVLLTTANSSAIPARIFSWPNSNSTPFLWASMTHVAQTAFAVCSLVMGFFSVLQEIPFKFTDYFVYSRVTSLKTGVCVASNVKRDSVVCFTPHWKFTLKNI